MKMLLIFFGLILSQTCAVKELSITGTWVNENEKQYLIRFTDSKFYEIYDRDTSVYKYKRIDKSCDVQYMKEAIKNVDFISLSDGRCFEITGLTDSTLTYRHTVSGKINTFHKLPQMR
jgi:hypothetical protein